MTDAEFKIARHFRVSPPYTLGECDLCGPDGPADSCLYTQIELPPFAASISEPDPTGPRQLFERVPYSRAFLAEQAGIDVADAPERCPGCSVIEGGIHHGRGCLCEECPQCRGDHFFCNCRQGGPPRGGPEFPPRPTWIYPDGEE